MKRICKICNQLRLCDFIKVSPSGAAICIDESGRKWRGKICGICTKPKEKIKKEPELNTFILAKCKVCHKEKPKILKSIYKLGQRKYVNLTGSHWGGKTCPDCIKDQRKVTKIQSECLRCGNNYTKRNIKHNYCNAKCRRPAKLRKKAQPKATYKKPFNYSTLEKSRPHCKILIKECITCKKFFVTSYQSAKACKTTCMPSYRKAKQFRRSIKRCRHQKISQYYKKEITEIYINRPEGMQVDHIIPLKGNNVSGLHVPWNLQYLTPEANNKKTNKI